MTQVTDKCALPNTVKQILTARVQIRICRSMCHKLCTKMSVLQVNFLSSVFSAKLTVMVQKVEILEVIVQKVGNKK